MLRIGVMVSGGGTNLQAIIDGISKGTITNTEIAIVVSTIKRHTHLKEQNRQVLRRSVFLQRIMRTENSLIRR